MRFCLRIFTALILCALAGLSLADSSNTYGVSAKLLHAGQIFAEPNAVVSAGKPANIETTGTDGYKLTLTVTDVAPDKIRVVANLESAHGAMTPTVLLRPDTPASVSVGDLELELKVSRRGG